MQAVASLAFCHVPALHQMQPDDPFTRLNVPCQQALHVPRSCPVYPALHMHLSITMLFTCEVVGASVVDDEVVGSGVVGGHLNVEPPVFFVVLSCLVSFHMKNFLIGFRRNAPLDALTLICYS